jgi:subtilisin family serine protease
MLKRRAAFTLNVNLMRGLAPHARLPSRLLAGSLNGIVALLAISQSAFAQSDRPVVVDPGSSFAPRPIARSVSAPPVVTGAIVADVRPRDVLVTLAPNMPEHTTGELSQDFGLELTNAFPSLLLATRVLRFHIPDARSLGDVVQQLSADARVQTVQPDYVFKVAGASKSLPGSQYAPQKMRLEEAQTSARGNQVTIAIIDTAIDQTHPALQEAVVETFSAIENATSGSVAHGTALAGIIAARAELKSVAPQAKLLSVQAFTEEAKAAAPENTSTENDNVAQSHTFAILKGLDWAVSKSARVVTMGFAGPNDPLLGQAIAAAFKQGVVVVAAAGNGGRDAQFAYPGAFPNVVAVTAIDRKDIVYQRANRGTYIALAAPGVDIAIAAPNAGYGLASGTSLAAAQVSGVVALMLETNPKLTPKEVRDALSKSAQQPPRLIAEDMGAGIVDAAAAVAAVK